MKEFKDCRNPVLPPEYHIADPEGHVMPDGRVYIYGSWDQSAESYCSKKYRVISSANMIDWMDHDISFDSSLVPWAGNPEAPRYPIVDWNFLDPTPGLLEVIKEIPIIGKMPSKLLKMILKKMGKNIDIGKSVKEPNNLYAPDAIHRNGKYYLYFCLSDFSEGVAVSENPEGPFEEVYHLRCGGIDPAVFIDDDGQAYYFWGQFRASGARLKNNMTELEEHSIVRNIVTEETHGFHEGSSIRKRNGIYYFVYPCIWRDKPTAMAYATSRHPLGPYEYRGIIIDNAACDPASWNIHGSIEEVNGQWYIFYHRSTGKSRYMRRFCVEPIYFNDDGTINEVKMTSQGAGRPFELDELLEGYRACQLSGGVYVDHSRLVNIQHGDKVCFRYVDWKEEPRQVQIKASGNGKIRLLCDGYDIGTVFIQDGDMIASEIKGPAGTHEIELEFTDTRGLALEGIVFHS